MTQEELFNYCLGELEEFSNSIWQPTPLGSMGNPEAIPNSILHLTHSDPILIAQECFQCKRIDVIKVMKSGIFYKGGLKGRRLSKINDHKIYFFKDLVGFILRATAHLVRENPKIYLHYYISSFNRADLPPAVVPSFKLGWSSSQARDPGGA